MGTLPADPVQPGARLSGSTRTRLSVMMFLQYAFNGIWIIPLNNYLTKTLNIPDHQAGLIGGTTALGFIIAPFFIGMIADRFFAAQKVLGVLNILAGVLLYIAATLSTPSPTLLFWIFLAHFICYAPTWALTNTIALNQMTDAGKQFPSIRVMGTFGWIAVSAVSLFSEPINRMLGTKVPFEYSNVPMLIGAAIGILTGIFSFLLPNTPPKNLGHRATFGDILGVKALQLFKDRNFCIFAVASFLIFLPNMYYWGFCNMYLNEIGMKSAQFKQSIGQMAEVIFLYLMPLFFIRWGVKTMLAVGFLAWLTRFVCFAFGYRSIAMAPLLYIGIALHGICYDFFFVTGQLYTDKKAPKQVQASAQGLISLITFGLGWFVGITLAGTVIGKHSTHELAARDILDKPAFYAKLEADGRGAAASPGKRIWELLDPAAQQAIKQSLQATDPARDAIIIQSLNQIMARPDFYREGDFASLKVNGEAQFKDRENALRDAQKNMLDKAPAAQKELNRWLLEFAFKDSVSPIRHQWSRIWMYPAIMAIALFAFFVISFKDKMLVVKKEEQRAPERSVAAST